MENKSRSHSAVLAVSFLLLGCGLLLIGRLNRAEQAQEPPSANERDVAAVPARRATVETNGFDYSSLADLQIQSGMQGTVKPDSWQTAAIFLADREGCQVFIGSHSPTPLQDPWKDGSTPLWSATVPLGDFNRHDVKVLDAKGRLLKGPRWVQVTAGEPSPIFKYVSD
jgi:hypothetical protein